PSIRARRGGDRSVAGAGGESARAGRHLSFGARSAPGRRPHPVAAERRADHADDPRPRPHQRLPHRQLRPHHTLGRRRPMRGPVCAQPARGRQRPRIAPIRLHPPAPGRGHRGEVRIRHDHLVAQRVQRLRTRPSADGPCGMHRARPRPAAVAARLLVDSTSGGARQTVHCAHDTHAMGASSGSASCGPATCAPRSPKRRWPTTHLDRRPRALLRYGAERSLPHARRPSADRPNPLRRLARPLISRRRPAMKVLLALLWLVPGTLMAAPQPEVTSLMSKDLPAFPGKEAVMITVEYPPGGADPVHRHNAYAFVYVLEGSVVMQVKGGKETTLTPGQTFYEGPDDVHVVGRNASDTKPAKFLVLLVKNKGAPVLVPVE